MTASSLWICRSLALGVFLWTFEAGTAGAFQMFPATEVQEAHALRQRVLAEIPELDLQRLHERPGLSPEAIAVVRQHLAALQVREAENPFFHWAQGELLRQTVSPTAGAPAFERARQAAGSRALIHWLLWQDYLAADLRSEAEVEERALQAIQVSWGLTRFPLLATEEMRLGNEAGDSGDLTRALALNDAALANTPESPEVLFSRASLVWQTDKSRVFEVIKDLAAGLFHSLRGREAAFRVPSNLLLSLLVTCLAALCLVAVIFAIKIQPLFVHELSERMLKSLPPPCQVSLGLLLFLLPLAAGLGLLWAAIAALLFCAPYMTGRERGTVSFLLAVLVVLPFGYEWVASRHVLVSSHHFAVVQAVEQGRRGETLVQDLRGWAEEASADGLPQYYLGLILKRRGELIQAEAAMARAAELLPGAGFVQVGLGNVQFLLGRLQEAEASYRRAAEVVPASAAVHLNLSKLYTQRLQLDQSKEALTRSLTLDPRMAQTVSPFHGQGFTQFVIDEPVPWDALAAGLAPRPGETGAVAEGFWGSPLRGVSLPLLPYAVGVLLLLFWTYVTLRGGMPPVRRCHQCGRPFCGRCQPNPKEKEYCSPCAAVFRQRDGVTAFVRGRRIREGEEWLRRKHACIGILGSVVPGGGDLYGGHLVRGMLLCMLAVWLLAEGFVLDRLTPSFRFVSPLPSPIRYTAAVLLLVVLYLYSVHRSWRRPITGVR